MMRLRSIWIRSRVAFFIFFITGLHGTGGSNVCNVRIDLPIDASFKLISYIYVQSLWLILPNKHKGIIVYSTNQ